MSEKDIERYEKLEAQLQRVVRSYYNGQVSKTKSGQ